MCEAFPIAQGATNCADCNSENPSFFNPNYEVFLCRSCAQIHEEIKCEKGKGKSVRLDSLNEAKQIQAKQADGNIKVNGRFERFLPNFFTKSGDATSSDIRREYILHKYIRETFLTHAQFQKYEQSVARMEGALEKKGKDKSVWKERHFVLSPLAIEYFIEKEQIEPKGSIPISQMELHVECQRGVSCLVLTHLSHKGASGRKYYVRSLLGGKDSSQLFDWYFALLGAQQKCDGSISATMSRAVLGSFGESMRITKSGTLYKVGTGSMDIWRRRWFALNGTHVTYATDKLSALPQGDFQIGSESSGYRVEDTVSHKIRAPSKFTFQVVTPERTYKLCAESGKERDEWMEVFSRAMEIEPVEKRFSQSI